MLRFLVNPTSGGGRAQRYLGDLKERAAGLGAELEFSTSGSDLTARAARAVREGVERLVVVGGDGAMHLAAQGLAQSDCELAVVPGGRGNDLASSLGVPSEFRQALDLAVSGKAREIDLGRVGELCFTLYAGAGFDSATSSRAEGQPRWWPDSLTYIIAVLRTLGGFRPPHARVEYDGGLYEGAVMFVTVCNAPLFGGGMRVAPEADMTDGQLDLVIVRAFSKLGLLRVFPRVYRGAHVGHPAISIHRTVRARLSLDPRQLLACDGELVGKVGGEPVTIEVQTRALRVVTP